MATTIENYFPQGLATENAFIGREKEITSLLKNIQTGHHTLLLAPRRYGKTSLAIETLTQLEVPYAEINCYLAVSPQAIERKILIAVQSILKQVISKPENILRSVQAFFNKSKKKWSIGFKGMMGVEITPGDHESSPDNILTALNLIEEVLKKHDKKALMFIDEIQEINNLDESKQIQAAIREFAQRAKRLVFIFSGSNRHMLAQMFDDKVMPLYELCERIILDRIEEKSYKEYLNKVSKATFGSALPEESFAKIMNITERHPKRVYNLCYYLWQVCEGHKRPPTVKDIDKAWSDYLVLRVKDTQYHLSRLSAGQLKVLTLIAAGFNQEISGKIAQQKVNMASSSIVNALRLLVEGDYIEIFPQGRYRVIDPLIKDILVKYEIVNLN